MDGAVQVGYSTSKQSRRAQQADFVGDNEIQWITMWPTILSENDMSASRFAKGQCNQQFNQCSPLSLILHDN